MSRGGTEDHDEVAAREPAPPGRDPGRHERAAEDPAPRRAPALQPRAELVPLDREEALAMRGSGWDARRAAPRAAAP